MKVEEISTLVGGIFFRTLTRGGYLRLLDFADRESLKYLVENEYILIPDHLVDRFYGHDEVFIARKGLELVDIKEHYVRFAKQNYIKDIFENERLQNIIKHESELMNHYIDNDIMFYLVKNNGYRASSFNNKFQGVNESQYDYSFTVCKKVLGKYNKEDISNYIVDLNLSHKDFKKRGFSNVIEVKKSILLEYVIENMQIHKKYDLPQDSYLLIGNGMNFNFKHSKYSNKALLDNLNSIKHFEHRVSRKKITNFLHKLNKLIAFLNYLTYEYFTIDEVRRFLLRDYSPSYNDKTIKLNHMSNTFLLLYLPLRDHILDSNTPFLLEEVSFEGIAILDKIARTDSFKNIGPSFISDRTLEEINYFFGTSILLSSIETFKDGGKEKLELLENYKGIILTTNYDLNLELCLGKKVMHLHGAFKHKDYSSFPKYPHQYDIIIGAESDDKIREIETNSTGTLSVFGTRKNLIIFGYSGSFNDDHINRHIRESRNIEKIIFVVNKLNDMSLNERSQMKMEKYFYFNQNLPLRKLIFIDVLDFLNNCKWDFMKNPECIK